MFPFLASMLSGVTGTAVAGGATGAAGMLGKIAGQQLLQPMQQIPDGSGQQQSSMPRQLQQNPALLRRAVAYWLAENKLPFS